MMTKNKNWQDEVALQRYAMITPLLSEDLDNAKRIAMREKIAQDNYDRQITLPIRKGIPRKRVSGAPADGSSEAAFSGAAGKLRRTSEGSHPAPVGNSGALGGTADPDP